MKTTNKMKTIINLSLLAGISAAIGCDGAANLDYRGEPLATIAGKLNTEGATEYLAPRAVLVWQDPRFLLVGLNTDADADQPINQFEKVAEDVAVVSAFPAEFSIQIFTPPPASVMIGGGAVGSVLIYDDLNQNGKLDLLEKGEDPIDKIIGESDEPVFFTLENEEVNLEALYDGICPSKEAPAIPAGVSLGRIEAHPWTGDGGEVPEDYCYLEVLFEEDNVSLTADLEPDVSQTHQCLVQPTSDYDYSVVAVKSTSELPEDGSFVCLFGALKYDDVVGGEFLCDDSVTVATWYEVEGEMPADWPCPNPED